MESKKFYPYGRQSINKEDVEEVITALNSNWITRGPTVQQFEKNFAEYCGAKYAVSFSSGTAALMASGFAAELGSFDKVITTPNTFVATAVPAIQAKAKTVFVDIDRNSGCLDLDLVKLNLEYQSTRGKLVIMPVHFAGIAVDIAALNEAIDDPNTIIIEDAAHALGSKYPDGQKVGSCAHSQMTIFSFHAVKNITTGEGGMVTTNSLDCYERLQRFKSNGIVRDEDDKTQDPGYYEVLDITGNYNITDFQAALGISQLKRLDQMVNKRRKLMNAYRNFLAKVPHIKLFSDRYDKNTAFHLMVLQIDFEAYNKTRREVMEKLMEKGIGTQVHYIPLYRQPFFKNELGDLSGNFPEMEKYYSQALTLPLFYDLEIDDVSYICESLIKIL